MVIIHAEAEVDIPIFAAELRKHDIQTGLAILPETQVADIAYALPHVQHVLIFAGHLGYHGGSADISQINKITDLKQYAQTVSYGWDGGVNEDNIQLIHDAGCTVINVGSCIHAAVDPGAQYHKLVSLVS
jgi:ribulose-phosphate 3-epimerase